MPPRKRRKAAQSLTTKSITDVNRMLYSDDSGTYPVIQGSSVEDLLADKRPDLPLYGYRPGGGRVSNQAAMLAN